MARISKKTFNSISKIALQVSRKLPTAIRLIIAVVVLVLTLVAAQYLPEPANESRRSDSPISTPKPTTLAVGEFKVERVVDGDTIVVEVNGQSQTVRLIGVDTPEVVDPRRPVQCFGQEASDRLKSLLHNQTVRLEKDSTQDDVDTYNRWLRYVYLTDGRNVNLLMISDGYAYEYTYRIPYVMQQQFMQAEEQARAQELGLWNLSTCNGKT